MEFSMSEESLRIIRRPALEKKMGTSRSWIYAEMAKPGSTFPKPIRLAGGSAVGWYEHEIDAYLASQPRADYRANKAAA
jgi:prophage regulatory protein